MLEPANSDSSFRTTKPTPDAGNRQVADDGPAGEGNYRVKPGECISSIAKGHGYFWETIWDHPANAALKAARRDPNILLAGDRLTLPPKTIKQESAATDTRHKFILKGEPTVLRMQLLEEGIPRANVNYVLEIDGHARNGSTDEQGYLDEPLRGDAKHGRLIIRIPDEEDEVIVLDFGHLDPITTICGVQGRLDHLGFQPGPIDGVPGPRTRIALRRFQIEYDLPATGEPDSQTRERLVEVHGR
jgi:hypothetical protein